MASRRFQEEVEAARRLNQGVFSNAFGARRGIPERTWRRWMAQYEPGDEVARGVRVLDPQPAPATRLRAALDANADAMLARRSALWLMGRLPSPLPLTIIIEEEQRGVEVLDVTVVRSRTLLTPHEGHLDGWPITRGPRTLMDLAIVHDEEWVLAMLIDLLFHEQVDLAEVRTMLAACTTAWGRGRLLRVVDRLGDASPDSIFEWWVAHECRALGLNPSNGPRMVATPDGVFEVDILLAGVAIECQGRHHFTDPRQIARDAAKAAALPLVGITPIPIDFPTFRADPKGFARKVARMVAAKAAEAHRTDEP